LGPVEIDERGGLVIDGPTPDAVVGGEGAASVVLNAELFEAGEGGEASGLGNAPVGLVPTPELVAPEGAALAQLE
jgi:hypothetical protein